MLSHNLNLQKQDIASLCYNKGLAHEKSLKNKFVFAREENKQHKENHRLL